MGNLADNLLDIISYNANVCGVTLAVSRIAAKDSARSWGLAFNSFHLLTNSIRSDAAETFVPPLLLAY